MFGCTETRHRSMTRQGRDTDDHHRAPVWLRRSDQAVAWARHMLTPRRAVVIDCETTDLPGGVTGNDGYQNLRNSSRAKLLR